MKFLVTGMPGWLGDRFVEALEGRVPELLPFLTDRDAEIRCLVLPDFISRLKQSSRVKYVSGDLTNKETLEEFFKGSQGAVLFHLAGLVHAFKGTKQFYEVNTQGTQNVLDCAVRHGVKRIIAVSSNSPAGCNPRPDHLFTEDMPYNPYMTYGRSKMLMEKAVLEASEKKRIESVILRPCWFYGPRQPARQTLFFSMIKDGKAPIVGSGNSKRSMSYVDNVCQALLLAAKTEKADGRIYWVTDKQPYTLNEIVDTIEELLEKEFKIPVRHKRLRLPDIASEIALGVDAALQSVGVYHQKIHVLSEMNKTIAASIERAEKELGYKPMVELKEGMRRSIQWCLENGHKI